MPQAEVKWEEAMMDILVPAVSFGQFKKCKGQKTCIENCDVSSLFLYNISPQSLVVEHLFDYGGWVDEYVDFIFTNPASMLRVVWID